MVTLLKLGFYSQTVKAQTTLLTENEPHRFSCLSFHLPYMMFVLINVYVNKKPKFNMFIIQSDQVSSENIE